VSLVCSLFVLPFLVSPLSGSSFLPGVIGLSSLVSFRSKNFGVGAGIMCGILSYQVVSYGLISICLSRFRRRVELAHRGHISHRQFSQGGRGAPGGDFLNHVLNVLALTLAGGDERAIGARVCPASYSHSHFG